MLNVQYLQQDNPTLEERCVVVVAHQCGMPKQDKAYFFDNSTVDHGGSGPFDWRLDEAIERAKQYALENKIRLVVVRPMETPEN